MDQLVLGDYPRALDEQGLKDCAALFTSPVNPGGPYPGCMRFHPGQIPPANAVAPTADTAPRCKAGILTSSSCSLLKRKGTKSALPTIAPSAWLSGDR
jgi:hypothetical protein